MKNVNNNVSNHMIWLVLGQGLDRNSLFKNSISVISYLSFDSLKYSNLYEHLRTKSSMQIVEK